MGCWCLQCVRSAARGSAAESSNKVRSRRVPHANPGAVSAPKHSSSCAGVAGVAALLSLDSIKSLTATYVT